MWLSGRVAKDRVDQLTADKKQRATDHGQTDKPLYETDHHRH
jgi:hypothetical protein